ncbi:MAG: Aminoglycoside phosphotransferase [Microgenomates group bacterium GW2011_GWC1_37_8]|uniref:Aminoglycoside phosphotransferase n=1 Tax=Candidatus Woesebacteria bacterium GW2011_GWB1_38_8 TaxID=1618570 RepID=A0A0G0LB59_9BACT|nr:MAG: Aminoglycoside phosphotransferase [Microgenomates group bacterium GW2011_GWC1_37_8]KKQ85085.1 MAG: Aminoglycoside phosphotransferase [Candidatus Woesebacteria bacterium GW2011_GWB1_38_8]
MSSKKTVKQHNPYQKYLEEKHNKLNAPNEIIEKVVKRATNSTMVNKKRIIEGEVNEVYEVITKDNQRVIVRISRSKHPRFEAEEKAIRLALMAGVPAPKVLLIEKVSLENENLTFCVEKKTEGQPLKNLMQNIDQETLKSIIAEAGQILSQIHSVKLDGFGGLDRDELYRSWEEFVLRPKQKLERITEAVKTMRIDINLVNEAIKILKDHTDLYKDTSPQLLHGDFSIKHFLIKNNHIVGIIDFENAKGGDPVFDFAWLNYFYGQVVPIDWLKEGYKNKDLFDSNFETKMKLYRLHLGLGFIDYYEYEKNEAGMNHTRQKFLEELKNF